MPVNQGFFETTNHFGQKNVRNIGGAVDTTLEYMANCLLTRQCDWDSMNQAAEQLKDALLEAEETYLSAEDEA